MDGEILPTDIPHKQIAWRPLVTIEEPFNPDTHGQLEPSITIHPDRVEKIYRTVPLTDEQKLSRRMRKIQDKFFNENTRHMTLLLQKVLNDSRVAQGLSPLEDSDFFQYLGDCL